MTAVAVALKGRPAAQCRSIEILPLKSKRWPELAGPVLAYVQAHPGRAREVARAMRNRYPHHIVLDCLAWLKLNGMARCDEADWNWRAQ